MSRDAPFVRSKKVGQCIQAPPSVLTTVACEYDCVVIERGIFRRILVGTDGSARAEDAVRQGARFASITQASLEVLFVIDTGRPHDEDLGPISEAAIRRARILAEKAGIEPDTRIVAGDPAERLTAEVADRRADLICVGPDAGLTTRPPRIGRVASRVLREAPCSVLVGRSIARSFPSRIVCGIDGSEDSADLAAFAMSIAAAAQAAIRLVHVIPLFQSRSAGRKLIEALTSPEFDRMTGDGSASDVVQTREVARGRPERRLVNMTKRDGTDLLVVGHRGVSGLHRLMLGSVSEYCAYNAACSVLVSRTPVFR
jgi:nucleotide-binding universal stress UspA family protein